MERIRVGLTGLGLVLLLVFVAAAGMRPVRAILPETSAGETLSALGVAPPQAAPKRPAPPANPSPSPPQPQKPL